MISVFPTSACQDFEADLLGLIPQLRAFTRMLSGERQKADDLAQDALAKAWQYQRSFQPGTNLKAWLFAIARNQFISARRRAMREGVFDQQAAEQIPDHTVGQVWSAELSETLRAVQRLPHPLREALLLVGPSGLSYEEAARICHCPVGTVKSRASRARRALAAMVDGPARGDDRRQSAPRRDPWTAAHFS
jgi:RNA polymerase sigma-70 factor (ECF subfamily)